MRSFVVGVDGGGTQARAVVLDASGHELARSSGPGAVATGSDPALSAEAVVGVVTAAAEEARAELPAGALWVGLAGAGREPTRSSVRRVLRGSGLARSVAVGTDLEAALHGALGGGPGILLLAGTGSVAVGRAEDGSETRVGGWGARLGDEGSGFWIGLGALRAVALGADGRSESTELETLVLERLGLEEPSELIDWVEVASKADVGALAPSVFSAAASGDAVAAGILADATADLARHVFVAHERCGPWSEAPSVVLAGGLLDVEGPLRERVVSALEPLDLTLVSRPVDAALGAAHKALQMLEPGFG